MENIPELFAYQSVAQPAGGQHIGPASGSMQSYANLNSKEIYAPNIQGLNVQHFNYDPTTQWISMPVINASQSQQPQQAGAHLQQIQMASQSHMSAAATPIQLQGQNVQRAQTVQYQQPSGETINVAIIQPLFIVNEQQAILQQLETVPATTTVHAQPVNAVAAALSEHPIEATISEIADDSLISEDSTNHLGKPKRKPKRPPEVIKAERELYLKQKIQRHAVKPPCNCKFRCSDKISQARRVEINRQYWELPYDKQRDFILHSVEILDVKRRKKRKSENETEQEADKDEAIVSSSTSFVKTEQSSNEQEAENMSQQQSEDEERLHIFQDDDEEPADKKETDTQTKKYRRGWTRAYSLKGDDGKFLTVCKAMFLTTLGFPEKVDGALRFLNKQQKGDIRARSPQRGKATPMKGATAKIDREVIKSHILSYKPVLVGRKKGQLRYLPGHLSMRKMHADFKTKYTERNVSYTIYAEVFRSLNIVFRKDPKGTTN